jgi:O-acetyl-ADP-ribose deacetylase (regulator of RNase III)
MVFKKIEKILGQTWLKIPSNQAPVLATSEFSQMETKLQNDYCVILSYPRPGLSSKVMHTTVINPRLSSHHLQLDICLGNIVHERVDAIVNAANEDLKHIGGLAKDILDSGGVTIQSESNQYVQSHGKVLTGTCVCLGAGKLPCKRIIHAVGPQWCGGEKGEEQTLYNTIYKCLECADKESLSSIALPAISTGYFGVSEEVSARASLTAVRDYYKSTADTNITKIRFVLYTKSALQHFGSAFKYMFPSQSDTPTESVTPTTSDPEIADTWSWENDQGSFSSYSTDTAAQLTKEYKRDPTSSVICTINRQSYRIDFITMLQINCSTGYHRKVQRVPRPQAPLAKSNLISDSNTSLHWEYRDDYHQWSPYKHHESQAIEEMYKDKTSGEISIGSNTYTFDFIHMYQINIRTRYKRQIQRIKASSSTVAVVRELALEQDQEVQRPTTDSANDKQDDHQSNSTSTETLTVSLRGPFDALHLAKTEVQEKLKSLYITQTIPFPPILEKKLTQLVQDHNIKWSLEKGGSKVKRNKRCRKVYKLNIEGIASEVNRVMMAIHEEIITHQIESESDGTVEFPEEWDEMGDLTTKIVPLTPSSDEWRKVSQKFRETLPLTRIVEITRIQNKWLWEKYVFQHKRMHAKNDGEINELELFHGTRTNDPELIYKNEDGFDMRYSNSGMWGQANYFAENASYSDRYAHRTYDGYNEMFFAKVLTGDSLDCNPDPSLRKPPFKPNGSIGGGLHFAQVQYDTVTGYTKGSRVYMTYDNEKAYPAYLIKYQ